MQPPPYIFMHLFEKLPKFSCVKPHSIVYYKYIT